MTIQNSIKRLKANKGINRISNIYGINRTKLSIKSSVVTIKVTQKMTSKVN
jgi:copper chaperone CopZ